MSPVRTATRASWGSISRVRSRRLVLPEPGELIRFTHSTPHSRKRSRKMVAIRSFSLSTFCSSGTRFMFFDLQVNQFQLVSANAFGRYLAALRALKVVLANREFVLTSSAAVTARAEFDLQLQAVQFGIANQGFEAELQGILVNGLHFADPDSYF